MTDLISRQAAIEAIERLILPQTKGETAAEEINRVAWRCAINCAEEMIGHLPRIDPVKHGKWVEHTEPEPWDKHQAWYWSCSECGAVGIDEFRYCPNCGARLDE